LNRYLHTSVERRSITENLKRAPKFEWKEKSKHIVQFAPTFNRIIYFGLLNIHLIKVLLV